MNFVLIVIITMVNVIIVNMDCMPMTIHIKTDNKTINDIIEPCQYRRYVVERGNININVKTQVHPANISKFVKHDQVFMITPYGGGVSSDFCDITKTCSDTSCKLQHFDHSLLSKYKEDKY